MKVISRNQVHAGRRQACAWFEYYIKIRINSKIAFIGAAEILDPLVERTEYAEEWSNISLRCMGVGHPPPLVQWRILNGSLSDRVSITNMSMSTNEGNLTRVTVDLLFTRIHREDTGIYVCSSMNILNTVTRNINLTVQCTYVRM